MALTLLLVAGVAAAQAPADPVVWIPEATPVHLALALRIAHAPALDAFRKAQQDPSSADYHRTLTPKEFGRRFGPSAQVYAKTCAWMRDAGFAVTEFPNRIFIEGAGTAAQVTKLLGVRLQAVAGQPATIHTPDISPRFPAGLAPFILHVSGLDTRVRFRHHLALTEVPTPERPATEALMWRRQFD